MHTLVSHPPLRIIASDEDDDLLVSDDVIEQPEEVGLPDDPGSELGGDNYTPPEEENPEEF
jgi:hypothetical protein